MKASLPLLLLVRSGGGDEENRDYPVFNVQHLLPRDGMMCIIPLYCAGIEGYIYIRFKSPSFSPYPESG